jgi:hypothetical protein
LRHHDQGLRLLLQQQRVLLYEVFRRVKHDRLFRLFFFEDKRLLGA